jgi:hypothetical protein
MEAKTLFYIIYLLTAVPLTLWVAHTLSKNGRVFLVDVFRGNEGIADAVNRLLVVGFYLINFGYICLWLKIDMPIAELSSGIEVWASKIGCILLVLGGMHLFNIFVFHKLRESRLKETELKEWNQANHAKKFDLS